MNLDTPTTRYSVTSGTKGEFKAHTFWFDTLPEAEACATQRVGDGGWAAIHDWHTDTHYQHQVTA